MGRRARKGLVMCLGIPGRLVETREEDPLLRVGRVDIGGVIKEVSLACVPDAVVGDYVLVHVGMALAVIDEAAAQRQLDDLRTMLELDALGQKP